jgi:hypothetical protein
MTYLKGSSMTRDHIHITAGELNEYFSGEMLDGEAVTLAQRIDECASCSLRADRVLLALNELDQVLHSGRAPIPVATLVAATVAVSVADSIRTGLRRLFTTFPSIADRLEQWIGQVVEPAVGVVLPVRRNSKGKYEFDLQWLPQNWALVLETPGPRVRRAVRTRGAITTSAFSLKSPDVEVSPRFESDTLNVQVKNFISDRAPLVVLISLVEGAEPQWRELRNESADPSVWVATFDKVSPTDDYLISFEPAAPGQ